MRVHPVASRSDPGTGFGFEEIMATPDYTRFRRWYDRTSFFATPGRMEAAAVVEPEHREAA